MLFFIDSKIHIARLSCKLYRSAYDSIIRMEIIYASGGNELRITPVGELDEHASNGARNSIDGAISKGGYRTVILDMSRLSFMDSTGIGVLVGRFKRFGSSTAFFISSPTQTVDKLLKLSGMYTIMPKIN